MFRDLPGYDDWRADYTTHLERFSHFVSEPDDEPNDQDATPLEPADEVQPDHELGGES